MTNTSELLKQRRFLPFFVTQLSTAFTDNLFKSLLVLLITYQAAVYAPGSSPALLSNSAAGLFILPFVLFSGLAGQLSDKFDKAVIMRRVKLAEIAIMAIAGAGFFFKNTPLLMSCVFFMGCHSAFFGPAKYATLPQTLETRELTAGNGLLEMGTVLSILLGTLSAALLYEGSSQPALVAGCFVVLAVGGWWASRSIPSMAAPNPDLNLQLNPWKQFKSSVRYARATPAVWLSLLGISWFWFFGALVLAQLPTLTLEHLHGQAPVVSALLALFSVGVALGSLSCERLSSSDVEIGLVPLGAFGLTVSTALLYASLLGAGQGADLAKSIALSRALVSADFWEAGLSLAAVGFFGGLMVVPLYSLAQMRTPAAMQSQMMALNNVLNAAFMVASALFAMAGLTLGLQPVELLGLAALFNLIVAVYVFRLVPEFLWRFVGWVLAHSTYRLKIEGKHHIPPAGAALLCPNHVTYVDVLFLFALSPRPLRFVMDHRIYRTPGLKWLCDSAKVIPIAPAKEDPQVLEKAMVAVQEALAAGEVVCIFPEGGLTRTGKLAPLKPGVLRLATQSQAPVIPVRMTGLWESRWSKNPRPLKGVQRLKEGRRLVTVQAFDPIAAQDLALATLAQALEPGTSVNQVN